MRLITVLYKGILFILFWFSFLYAFSADKTIHPQDSISPEKEQKFEPGRFIFDHIGDSYERHIFTLRGLNVTVPLPVILYSKYSGFHFFFSNKFKHGYESYRGFYLEKYGPNRKKIVEKINAGTPEETTTLPLNLSISKNVVAMLFSFGLILCIFISMARHYRRNPNRPPKGVGAFFEPIIIFVRDDIVKSAIGEKRYEEFLPYLLSLFFFIWITNTLGLIPIFPMGANVTGNIAVAMGLAIYTFLIVNISGNKNYWKHIFNTPGIPVFLKLPIPLMPIVEIFGIISKPFILMVRLFANITAGHIITLAFLSLIFVFGEISPQFGFGISGLSVLFGIFMKMLELLVSLIQAYVFTLLTALYIGAAVLEEH